MLQMMEQGTKGQSSNPIDGTKVAKILETTKSNYSNYANSVRDAIAIISKAIGAKNTGTSNYITIKAKNGTVFTLRLSNHNAVVSNFDHNGESNGISIIIARHANSGINNNGNAHIVEFFYSDKALNKADGTPIADIIVCALEQTMYSGEYTDPTGLAQRQEVNIPAAAPLLTPSGTVYGWSIGNEIWLTDEGINPETPIHEYTHLWAKAMKNSNKKAWAQIVKLCKQNKELWDNVANDSNYANLNGDEDMIASEVLSRYSGTRGADRLVQEMETLLGEGRAVDANMYVSRIQKALQKLWDWICDTFGLTRFRSLEEAADKSLYDLLGERDVAQFRK